MSFFLKLAETLTTITSYVGAGAVISYVNKLFQEEKGSLTVFDYKSYCVLKLDSSYNSKISKIIINDPFSLTHHKKEYVEFKPESHNKESPAQKNKFEGAEY